MAGDNSAMIERVTRAIREIGEGDLSPMIYVDPKNAALAAIAAMRKTDRNRKEHLLNSEIKRLRTALASKDAEIELLRDRIAGDEAKTDQILDTAEKQFAAIAELQDSLSRILSKIGGDF